MPKSKEKTETKIDRLALKIDKVVYKNKMLGANAIVKEFNPNIDETFNDVTNQPKIAGEIALKILSQIGIANQAQFSLKELENIGVQRAIEGIKKIFDK